jgi:uncharacterized protein (DUF488 family)
MNTLFTIGHSDYPAGHLLSLLRRHGVAAVADVRSSPYSQRSPQFNRENLKSTLKSAGLIYVFLGRELGARREEKECYIEGRADYLLIAKLPLFQEGLRRLQQGLTRMPLALLCAEHDPLACHRTILICRSLRDSCPDIQHIRRDGGLESNAKAELRLLKELGFGDSNATPEIINQAYDLQGRHIAYTNECAHEETGIPQEYLRL